MKPPHLAADWRGGGGVWGGGGGSPEKFSLKLVSCFWHYFKLTDVWSLKAALCGCPGMKHPGPASQLDSSVDWWAVCLPESAGDCAFG